MDCVQKAIGAANDRETSTRPRPAQRIVVVTDGTTPAWYGSEQRLQQIHTTIQENNLPVQIQVLEMESPLTDFENLSVVNMETDSDRIGVKKPITMSAVIQNTGAVDSEPCRFAWSVTDKEKDEEKILGHSPVKELEPGQSTRIVWSTRFKDAGPVAIKGALDQQQPDHLPEDSVAIKVVDVVDQIPILLIDNESGAGTANQQSQQITFLTLALGYQGEEANERAHSIFAPTIIQTSDVGSEDLSAYSAIIVAGTNNDSSELSELLLPEVRRGCGLWVLIDAKPDVDAFNKNWFQDGAGLSPLPLIDAPQETASDDDVVSNTDNTNPDTKNAEVFIHPPSAQHPATRVLSDQQRVDLDQVTVEKHAFFQPMLLGDEVSVPLQSNRGQPLVVENAIGQGRVLFQSFPNTIDATNWPVTSSFVIMVREWVEYLAQPSARSLNLSSGSPLVWKFEDRFERPASLKLPDGTMIDLTQDAKAHGIDGPSGTFRYFATRLPGDREELLAAPMSEENRSQLTDIGEFDLATSSNDLLAKAKTFWSQRDTTSSTAGGQPLWQWIVLALLGLVLLELLLAGKVGRLRCGNASSASQQLDAMQLVRGRPNNTGSTQGKNSKTKRKPASVG